MQALLNFFGEKTEIALPLTLSGLRKCICDQYLFTQNDADELIISYAKDFNKVNIKTENDYQALLQAKTVKELNLDVSENSKLYQDKKKTVAEEHQALLLQLAKMKTEEESMLNENSQFVGQLEMKQKEITDQMNLLKDQIIQIHFDFKAYFNEQTKKINGKRKEIRELEETLNIPQEDRLKPVEIEQLFIHQHKWHGKHKENYRFNHHLNLYNQKDLSNKNKSRDKEALVPKQIEEKPKEVKSNPINVIHYKYSCDACGTKPIKGTRYKCTICDNFDYCEACEELYREIHLHPFICITDLQNIQIANAKYNPKDFPPFNKNLHNIH